MTNVKLKIIIHKEEKVPKMAQKWQVEEQTQNANKDNSNTADLTSLSVEETAPEEPTILSRVKLVFSLFLVGVTIPAMTTSLCLRNNSHYKIEIGGHTDRLGSEEYNLDLSEKRALSVYNYLLSKQEELSNLSYKGYGSTIPLRKKYDGPKNRRIEFKILK